MAFTAAAGISLFFTLPRLFFAIQGGEGAPDIFATTQNAAINIAGNTFKIKSCPFIVDFQVKRVSGLSG